MAESPGRNDPCPCGSGRKTKSCCGLGNTSRTAGDPSTPSTAGVLRRDILELARREERWEADAIPLPIGIGDGSSHRPVTAMVTAGEFVIASHFRDRVGGEPDEVAECLERGIVMAATELGSYPAILAVRFAELVEPLGERLRPRGTAVRFDPELPNLRAAACEMIRHFTGEVFWPPASAADSWAAWRVPAAMIRAIFDAAALFWRAAPWKSISSDQPLEVTLPGGRTWTVSVLGNLGESHGLAIYSNRNDLIRTLASEDSTGSLALMQGRSLSVGFDSVKKLSQSLVREARLAGWRTAGPDAFPLLFTINTPGGGLSRADAVDLELLLTVVPRFVVAHVDDLRLELQTEIPGPRLEWRDSESGALFHYDPVELEDRVLSMQRELGLAKGDDEFSNPAAAERIGFDVSGMMEEVQRDLGPEADPDQLLAELNRRVEEASVAYNERPQEVLAGLSPDAVSRLLAANWLTGEGPIKLTRDLPLSALKGSWQFMNARVLLEAAAREDGLKATQGGNLGMKVVESLIDRIHPPGYADSFRRYSTRFREEDVWPLHRTRVLLDLAGLLTLARGRFRATEEGRRMLEESAAGELFATLFDTAFQRFNLAYDCHLPDWPDLQETAAFTLYALSRVGREWRTAEELLPEVVLPGVLGRPPAELEDLALEHLLESRVLLMLAAFGLVEGRDSRSRAGKVQDTRYRITPLFGRFMRFRF